MYYLFILAYKVNLRALRVPSDLDEKNSRLIPGFFQVPEWISRSNFIIICRLITVNYLIMKVIVTGYSVL